MPALSLAIWSEGQDGSITSELALADGGTTPYRLVCAWKGTPSGIVFTSVSVETEDTDSPVTGEVLQTVMEMFDEWAVRAKVEVMVAVAQHLQSYSMTFGTAPAQIAIEFDHGEVTMTAGTRVHRGTGHLNFKGDKAEMQIELARRERQDKRRQAFTAEDYKRIGEVYAAAVERGEPVRAAVARAFGAGKTSEKSAARWITEARKRGYIAPRRVGRPRKTMVEESS